MSGLRILTISDIQGNLNVIHELYERELNKGTAIDIIIHTGNFGFWNNETIDEYKDLNYLKQIVAFLEVLEPHLVEKLNNLSLINHSTSTLPPIEEFNNFKNIIFESENSLSQFQLYVTGELKLPCPVYTIFGPLDDPKIINRFHTGELRIPNLHLVDHMNHFIVKTPLSSQPNIKLYGLGGSLKIHSLFDNGNLSYPSISGKVGDLWISLIQIADLYSRIVNDTEEPLRNTINIFISHAPVIKNPLLEHLAIITNADFTISQGLHFRYPVMGNGMSFVDSMGGSAGYIENYRSKFSRLRMILGELWLIIKDEMAELLDSEDSSKLKESIELGLSLFDKIPISINDSIDKIVPLTLKVVEEETEDEASKKILKKINDFYFQAYFNLWHFNLCDYVSTAAVLQDLDKYNVMIFKLDAQGNFKLDYTNSQGFNFKFKVQEDGGKSSSNSDEEELYDDYDTSQELAEDSYTHKVLKASAVEFSPKTGLKRQILRTKLIEEYEEDVSYSTPTSETEEDGEFDDGKYLSRRGRGVGRGRGRGRGRPFRGRFSTRGRKV